MFLLPYTHFQLPNHNIIIFACSTIRQNKEAANSQEKLHYCRTNTYVSEQTGQKEWSRGDEGNIWPSASSFDLFHLLTIYLTT